MKAKKVYYKRLFNLGNFSNAEIGIELEIEDNEKAKDVLIKAKEFVEMFNPTIDREAKIKYFTKIVDNPRNYSYAEVEDAKKELEELKDDSLDDLPF